MTLLFDILRFLAVSLAAISIGALIRVIVTSIRLSRLDSRNGPKGMWLGLFVVSYVMLAASSSFLSIQRLGEPIIAGWSVWNIIAYSAGILALWQIHKQSAVLLRDEEGKERGTSL
jgi:hypothetical protein